METNVFESLPCLMEQMTAVRLIHAGVPRNEGSTWADLGCGEGLFTMALAMTIRTEFQLYAVDDNPRALKKIRPIPFVDLKKIEANFEKDDLPFSNLDGILMANSLHFVKDKASFLQKARTWLKPDGRFIIVEYDTDTANQWVPYPISFESCKKLFEGLGFTIQKIGEQKSVYNRAGMYAAVLTQPDERV